MPHPSQRPRTLVALAAALPLVATAPAALATPSGSPTPSVGPSPTPSSTASRAPSPAASGTTSGATTVATGSPAPAAPTATATPSAPATSASARVTTSASASVRAAATRAATITLAAPTCTGACAPAGPTAGFGALRVTGTTTLPVGTALQVVEVVGRTELLVGSTTVGTGGAITTSAPLNWAGAVAVVVRTADRATTGSSTAVTVRAATISMASTFSASTMAGTPVSGTLGTKGARRAVRLSVWRWFAAEHTSRWSYHKTVTTDANGRFSTTLSTDNGWLGSRAWKVESPYGNHPEAYFSTTFTERKIARMDASISGVTAAMVPNTWHAGCPVGPSQLRKVSMNYFGFDGRLHSGYVIVNASHATKVQTVFTAAFTAHFPFRAMKDPSPYGNDDASMAADNTYGFYCRQVNGNPYSMSPHSYGRSLDVNTVENPYQKPNGVWYPVNGRPYVDRSNRRPGMLFTDSPMTKAFLANGFTWLVGFDWQHFQAK